jgi:hypothetical protein
VEAGFGLLLATGSRPTGAHLEISVAVDSGAGYVAQGDVEFAAKALTLSALTSEADDDVITVANSGELDAVTANSLAIMGTEIVRIDSFADNAGNIDITLGRGCLDTVPVAHPAGTPVLFFEGVSPIATEFTATDAVDVKLLTVLASETLGLTAAPVNEVTFASRAIRPYPPGRFKVSGSYEQNLSPNDVVLTWVHRDRLQQVGAVPADHDDAGIGPEAGTTYRVRAEALDADDALISTVTDTNVGSVLTYDWNDATALPGNTFRVRFSVASVRAGYESWQRPAISIAVGPSVFAIEDGIEARAIEDDETDFRAIEG